MPSTDSLELSPLLNKRRILIVAGGTGGHITPALAVGSALQKMYADKVCVRYVTGNRPIERTAFESAEEFPDHLACSRPPSLSLSGAGNSLQLVRSFFSAKALLKKFQPHAVLATGGYVCAPLLAAARLQKVPYYLHESNSVPGKVTRMFCRKSQKTFLGSSLAIERFKTASIEHTGTPIRPSLGNNCRVQALKTFGFSKDRPGILILGGSQGARAINDMIMDLLSLLDELPLSQLPFNVLWAAGPLNYASLQKRVNKIASPIHQICVRDYIQDMGAAYAMSDLVISRAGAGTLAELAALKKPSILIPYPHAADRHQHANAREFSEAGAAILIDETNLSTKIVSEHLVETFGAASKRQAMEDACETLYQHDGVERICRQLMNDHPQKISRDSNQIAMIA